MSIEKVVLKISNELFPYIATKPMHGSQKVKERSESFVVIELELIPNYELESLILSYGEGVEILSPETLREKITNRIKLLSEKYI